MNLKIHRSFQEHQRVHCTNGQIDIFLLHDFLFRLGRMRERLTSKRFYEQFGGLRDQNRALLRYDRHIGIQFHDVLDSSQGQT